MEANRATQRTESFGMNVKEAAKYLKVCEVTIYRWCQTKKIPSVKVGGGWRIHKSTLDKMLTGEWLNSLRQIT